jgi:hypothetical protein
VSVTAEALAADLAGARDRAEDLVGRPTLGLRAIETGAGRWYLCAFPGPTFLCLTGALAPETFERRARDAAAAGLLQERVEQLVDADALQGLAAAAGRALARGDEDAATAGALGAVAEAALELAAWRAAPERALASVPELDHAVRLHEGVRTAYGRFVHASEGLVAGQDSLDAGRVALLRGVEEAAGAAGVGESLARRLGDAMEDCEEAAGQVVSAHVRPFEG